MLGTVITCQLTPGRGGKISPGFYLPAFAGVLKRRGFVHREANGVDQLRSLSPSQEKTVVVLIYNELDIHKSKDYRSRAQALESCAVELFGAESIIQPLRDGLKIGDKMAANHWLSAAGIPMPRLITGSAAPVRTFSNLRFGTHQPVQLLEPGEALDGARYNTKFIDTVREYRGQRFHISLRAMCVGRRCVATYVRARPVEDDDPSVHTVDTPLDPEMINYFYETTVLNRISAIDAFCDHLGGVLGLGFYAHDILPEARTGKLYLCETGYKFDESNLRRHLKPLRGQVAFSDGLFEPFVAASAKAFLREARDLGFLPHSGKSPARRLARLIRATLGLRGTSKAHA